jgi:hypothetical protein
MRHAPDRFRVTATPVRRLARDRPRARRLRAALALGVVAGVLSAVAPSASALPAKLSTNGQVDFVYGSSASSAGGQGTSLEPESKLFHTGDGSAEPIRWWAVLGTSGPTPAAGVWLFELLGHTWTARVRLPAADAWAKADALFEGGTLYVSTRDDKASAGGNARQSSLYRIPYLGGGAWGGVQGPFAITTGTLETLTIARDSADRLWATYESNNQIKVAFTPPGGTSFTTLTISRTNVTSDDVSAMGPVGGGRVGGVWSGQ